MKPLLKHIRRSLQDSLPFVVYHKPMSAKVEAFFQKDSSLHLCHELNGSGFVFAPFDKGETVLFRSEDCHRESHHYLDLVADMETVQESNPKGSHDRDAEKKHQELVNCALRHIRQGKATKLVVSRREETAAPDDLGAVFISLLHHYPRAFTYLWFHPDVGIWMGATPEILMQASGRSFRTIALAGTMLDEGSIEPVWGEKEKEEQRMVTEHIRKELGGIALQVEETRTVKAGDLLHLRTDLHGEFNADTSLSEVVRKLHPTAAVCGLPRKEAKSFILEQEDYQREYYTGFLGELDLPDEGSKKQEKPCRSLLFVNLRCMKIQPECNRAIIYVGGGVTASSDPVKEWQETVAKSLTMKKVLSHS